LPAKLLKILRKTDVFPRKIVSLSFKIIKVNFFNKNIVMKLIADSGSTKTDWCVLDVEDKVRSRVSTQGINPFHMSEDTVLGVLRNELLLHLGTLISSVDEIEFYGAGCTVAKIPVMQRLLSDVFPSARKVIVGSDMLGAAKALLGNKEGIACILGTGANSCLYDGEKIIANVSPMGYILGDEGSGAVLGKTFINELYKGGHSDFINVFEKETGLTQADIIQKVYREPLPNRFLASLSKFIGAHIAEEQWIEDMVVDCFRDFFRKNVRHYNRKDLSVSFVGSVAYYYKAQLEKAAEIEGFVIGKVLKSPLQ
jgi:N-acetylglucosamine kinase-like BadF-type ATPase